MNIPYLVDNLWEYLRPDSMPSRRKAIYASPTPELARANASAGFAHPDDYTVFELQFEPGDYLVAQLSVKDARDHPDKNRLQRLVMETLGRDWTGQTMDARLAIAPLFMPALSAPDMRLLAERCPLAASILDLAAGKSDFWPSATSAVIDESDGELFLAAVRPDAGIWYRPLRET